MDRHPLPNLRAVNFVVHGILGWGVASNLRLDTQAKGLGDAPLPLRGGPVLVGLERAGGGALHRLAERRLSEPGAERTRRLSEPAAWPAVSKRQERRLAG